MKEKFQKSSTLFGFMIFSFCIGACILGFYKWVKPSFAKKEFILQIQKTLDSEKYHYLNTFEFLVREGSLPYGAEEFAEILKQKLNLEFLTIYDDRFKLIYSTKPNPSLFQNELKNDSEGIEPGKIFRLSVGNYIYLDKTGKFFFEFPEPKEIPTSIKNSNLELGFTYWVFGEENNEIIFTNDDSILTKDREGKELLNLFRGKEGQLISWTLDGEPRVLEKINLEKYSIYLLEQKSPLTREILFSVFLLTISIFSFLFYLRLFYLESNQIKFLVKKRFLFSITIFLLTVVFYEAAGSLFPDYRYYKPWATQRFFETEQILADLERNITEDSFELNRIKYDSIVREIYIWQKLESETAIINRFGSEIRNSIYQAEYSQSSILIEANYDFIFLIPKKNKITNSLSVLLLVLNSERLYAKKSKDLDEFYFPSVSNVLSQNKGKEQVKENPHIWKESNFKIGSSKNHGSLYFLDQKFDSYYSAKVEKTASFFRGLYILKTQTKAPYFLFFGFFLFSPLYFFYIWKRGELITSPFENLKISNHLGEDASIKMDSNLIVIESNPPEIIETHTKNIQNQSEMREEGIEMKPNVDINNLTTVKKNHLKFLPPITWKKNRILDPIQKKRESIFNPELRTLVEKVSSPLPSPSPYEKEENGVWIIPEEKKFEYSLLDRIYRNDGISLDGIVTYTQNFISRFGSPRFSYLFLNDEFGSYHSQISSGLDYNTRSNLIFVHHDPYLVFDESGFARIDVTEQVRLDRFISKKFSWEILIQTDCIVAFRMDSLGFSGIFMVLLTKEEKLKFLESHKRMIFDKLKQVIPALHMLMYKEENKPDYLEDNLSWMVRSFLQATFGGKRSASVLRVDWPKYKPTPENQKLKSDFLKQISMYMNHKDRIIETSPSSIVVVTENDLYLKILGHLETLPFEHEIKIKKFPDDGQNYYLYL